MKTIMKGAIRNEKGSALPLVLVLLVVGGLILAPLLGLMSTGLIAGQIYEERMDLYYAADAGVEDAIWRIQTNNLTVDPNNRAYPEPLSMNDGNVNVVIHRYDWDPTCAENLTYQILSTATSTDGSSTTIDARLVVSHLDLSALLDNAIVSNDTIDIQPGNYVDGDIWLPDADDLEISKGSQIDGNIKDSSNMTMDWPTYEQLSLYYLDDVEGAPDLDPTIDINNLNPKTVGPCFRQGSLTVDNTGSPATLLLEGTVYVTGNLEFEQSGTGKNYTIDLNEQTIFVEGTIGFPSNVVGISGPGCIIARYDINFQPSIAGNDFVLVYSIEGEVNFQPSGNFTGCIAGNVHVQLQPGNTINWISPDGKGLNVPWGAGNLTKLPAVTGSRIESWEIS